MSIDQIRAGNLSRMEPATAKRIRSCGGAEGGAFLRACRADMGPSFTDNEFVLATCYRLGMRTMQQGSASTRHWLRAVRHALSAEPQQMQMATMQCSARREAPHTQRIHKDATSF